jgi:hypothetical protein
VERRESNSSSFLAGELAPDRAELLALRLELGVVDEKLGE